MRNKNIKMKEGISFIVRIRNEENVLEQSIRSLFSIKVPHEILLILHLCTDKSKQIAESLSKENKNIRILEYNTPISRPGYETLCTDTKSDHSIGTYYTWCYDQSVYPWKSKWDADFIATNELIDYINGSSWWEDSTQSHELFFNAVSPSGVKNTERYITSGTYTFSKYYFWEMIELKQPVLALYPGVDIIHQSELSDKKKYWNDVPWFLDMNYLNNHPEHHQEALTVFRRYLKVVEICGPEPNAHARAMNPEDEVVFFKVKDNIDKLKEFGIDAF